VKELLDWLKPEIEQRFDATVSELMGRRPRSSLPTLGGSGLTAGWNVMIRCSGRWSLIQCEGSIQVSCGWHLVGATAATLHFPDGEQMLDEEDGHSPEPVCGE
jgi:hypothetical protein